MWKIPIIISVAKPRNGRNSLKSAETFPIGKPIKTGREKKHKQPKVRMRIVRNLLNGPVLPVVWALDFDNQR